MKIAEEMTSDKVLRLIEDRVRRHHQFNRLSITDLGLQIKHKVQDTIREDEKKAAIQKREDERKAALQKIQDAKLQEQAMTLMHSTCDKTCSEICFEQLLL